MYFLSITQRLHRRKNNQNAFERWRIQIYTHVDLNCLGNIINQSNKYTQVIMRRPGD